MVWSCTSAQLVDTAPTTSMWRNARTVNDPWDQAANLGPLVNTPYRDQYPCLSPDGLLLFFSDDWGFTPRPGGFGGADLWMARRASLSDPWQAPVNLGPVVNGVGEEYQPRIAPDGQRLYFCSQRGVGWGEYEAPILPNCDFNGDGKVDEKDLQILMQHWGQSYPRCDIGPFPWGDGVVDEKDLKVLMEMISANGAGVSPSPHASDVPRDATLSWTSPVFATAHDVYFGTSFEDVEQRGPEQSARRLGQQGPDRDHLRSQRSPYLRPNLLLADRRSRRCP